MLYYLDNWQSSVQRHYPATKDKPAKTVGGINENYARELMELHGGAIRIGYKEELRHGGCDYRTQRCDARIHQPCVCPFDIDHGQGDLRAAELLGIKGIDLFPAWTARPGTEQFQLDVTNRDPDAAQNISV